MSNDKKKKDLPGIILYSLAIAVGAASLGLFALAEVKPQEVSLAAVGTLLAFGILCLAAAGLNSVKRR